MKALVFTVTWMFFTELTVSGLQLKKPGPIETQGLIDPIYRDLIEALAS